MWLSISGSAASDVTSRGGARTSRGAEAEQDGCVCVDGELREGDNSHFCTDATQSSRESRATPSSTAKVRRVFFPSSSSFFPPVVLPGVTSLRRASSGRRGGSPSPGPTVHSPALCFPHTLARSEKLRKLDPCSRDAFERCHCCVLEVRQH